MKPLLGDHEADVAVIGAGLPAALAALELTERGRRVVAVAAGPAAPELGHVPVGTGHPYSEVVERLGAAVAQELWGAHRENHERLRELLTRLGDDCGHRQAGGFLMAASRAEGEALAESEDRLRDDGFPGEFLDHYMLEARFDLTGFAGGYWAVDEGEVDAARLLGVVTAAAAGRGAVFLEAEAVLDLDLSARSVELVSAGGRLRAPLAVATAEVPVPFLESRLSRAPLRVAAATMEPDSELPSPARVVGGVPAWRLEGRKLRLLGDSGLEDLAGRLHATGLAGQVVGGTPCGPDGLPLLGLLPGLPVAVLGGGLAYALVGVRWAVEALLAGRDPTPAPLRAGRPLDGRRIPQ